jgi:hypothetical protein
MKTLAKQYSHDEWVLAETLRGNSNTKVFTEGGKVKLQLYDTVVLSWDPAANTVELNSDGFITATTKRRINEALQLLGFNASIYQKAGKWYVDKQGQEPIEFVDGLSVAAKKKVVATKLSNADVTVYDEGDASTHKDRYTVVIGQDVYGMSEDAEDPHGFNHWLGNVANIQPGEHLGEEVKMGSLPEQVKNAIKARILDFNEIVGEPEPEKQVEASRKVVALDASFGEALLKFVSFSKEGDRYKTSWGTKTLQGLEASISRLIKENPDNATLGREFAGFVMLRSGKDGRYPTSWGTKTALGLGASLRRLLEDSPVNASKKTQAGASRFDVDLNVVDKDGKESFITIPMAPEALAEMIKQSGPFKVIDAGAWFDVDDIENRDITELNNKITEVFELDKDAPYILRVLSKEKTFDEACEIIESAKYDYLDADVVSEDDLGHALLEDSKISSDAALQFVDFAKLGLAAVKAGWIIDPSSRRAVRVGFSEDIDTL